MCFTNVSSKGIRNQTIWDQILLRVSLVTLLKSMGQILILVTLVDVWISVDSYSGVKSL